VVSLVPTMLARMLEMGWEGSPSLRMALLGGGPCSPPLLNAAIERRIPVAPTYGLTEASSQITVLLPAETRGHFGTAGRPLAGVSVRVGEHADAPAPVGTPGRIWLSGPMIAHDSLDGPLLDGAWLGTNDMGRLDAGGYLTLLGRLDDVIITGGEKVIPSEVEAEITDDPLVGEVAVMGVPDAEWGQRVIAIITPREPTKTPDVEALREMLKKKLVPHKVPKQIRVVERLPRTQMGKLDRAALRELGERDG